MTDVNQLWVERYRPRTIADCVLPEDLKNTFSEFVKSNYVPNLLLSGGAGVGKTTVARAMLEECDFEYIVINGSMNGNIDTLRTEIRDFASTMSFSGNRKYVILDEADYLNPQSTQPALRNFMEEYSKNCGFIMTCNFKNRIIEPLHSRCSVVDFNLRVKDRPKLAKQFMIRIRNILEENNVEYKDEVIAELILKHFPDWRRVLNELQRYSATGSVIDAGVLANLSDDNFKEIITFLKKKNFKEMRKWVGKNSDVEPSVMFRKLYDASCNVLKPASVPRIVLILADYGYKSAFVVDQEINLVACLTEIMMECEFK
jgi:DNA polymerase III delta prime subunit